VVGEVGGTERPAANEPFFVGPVVARDRVLALRDGADGRRLVLWDPATGGDEAIDVADDFPRDLVAVQPRGRRADHDRHLVSLEGPGGSSWAVLEPGRRTCRELTARAPEIWGEAVALLESGALLAIEGGKRLVRLGPARGEREVLFPRP
jgi:hypothetical protein